MAPKVFVIVLNYQAPEDTLECLESVHRCTYAALNLVLVDNHSLDGCVDRAREKFKDLLVLENDTNLGYAEGNNRGIRLAIEKGADYIFILNNDAVVEPDAIQRLVEAGEELPEAGILAPKILVYGKDGVIDSCGTDMDWFKLRPKLGFCGMKNGENLQGRFTGPVFPGSALMLKKSLIEKAGMFDPGFFLVHEDADLCFRSVRHGFKNLLVPQAVVYHKVSRTLSRLPFLSEYYSARNFLYLSKRYASTMQKMQTMAGMAALMLRKWAGYRRANEYEKQKIQGFFCGVRDYWAGRKGACETKP